MTLTEKYQQAIVEQNMVEDPAQIQTLRELQQVSETLGQPRIQYPLQQHYPILMTGFRWLNYIRAKYTTVPKNGIYLWGDVGRGKTWLMNLFFEHLSITEKRRLHFHVFMQSIHQQLGKMKKQKDPLKIIGRDFARDIRVLCLDEFIVTNIADAMLLRGLLQSLIDNGVTLIVTSNRVPDDLYLNGLQRERFLPAIELIKQHTHVIHLDNGIDHRLALPEQPQLYLQPDNEQNNKQLEIHFHELSAGVYQKNASITLFKRSIKTVALANKIAWFSFNVICNTPRAAQDYIEIARQFHTVFISAVPQMNASNDDKARRFIYLIDALYDSRVKLLISAQQEPEKLYSGTMLEFAFHRTCSRLIEMRSQTYLAQQYHPQ